MADMWNTVVQAVLTVGMTAFFAWRLERLRGEQTKALQRSDTDRIQYLEALKTDHAKGIEGVKAQLLVLTRLQAGVDEKRAEVAAEVLVSTLQFLDGLEFVTNSLHMGGGANGEKITFADGVSARWQAIHGLELNFSKGRASADTFLGDDVAEFLKRVWDQRKEIWANQSTHFAVIQQSPHDRDFFRRGFGSEPAAALTRLRVDARALLRPIIQHEKALAERTSTR